MNTEPEELPDWVFPPPGGFRSADLDQMPASPSHTQLIDGSLVFRTPQSRFHSLMTRVIEMALIRAAPRDTEVVQGMTVTLADDQRLEPDVMVVRRSGATGLDQVTWHPADAVLVVEVVDGDSIIRDRVRKPQLYAEAGIRHLWRAECDGGQGVVYTYERDPATRAYVPSGIHRERLKVGVPFDIDIDLTEIHGM